MKWTWAILIAVGLVKLGLLIGLPARAAEVGLDTLMSAEDSRSWRGVGRVNVTDHRRRVMCTGTLIAPDVVLTAAHCLISRRTGRLYRPEHIHFVTGLYRGRKTGHSRARAVVTHRRWTGAPVTTTAAVATDLALIRLEKPMKPRAAEPFTIGAPPLPGAPVSLISYRRDRPYALTRQDGCTYRSMVDTVMSLDCAVIYGASGAPVFANVDGLPRIVAVLAAMNRYGQGVEARAFAARIDIEIDDLLTRLAE